ncbi:MAG: hypothetical protein ACK4F7_08195 [Inhella sp.]
MNRYPLAPPQRRRTGVDRVLSVLAATGLGITLALLLVHWAACEGVC